MLTPWLLWVLVVEIVGETVGWGAGTRIKALFARQIKVLALVAGCAGSRLAGAGQALIAARLASAVLGQVVTVVTLLAFKRDVVALEATICTL